MNLFPLLFAVVDREAASLPLPGSVKQYDPNFSIDAINGTYFERCSRVPYLSIIQHTMLDYSNIYFISNMASIEKMFSPMFDMQMNQQFQLTYV